MKLKELAKDYALATQGIFSLVIMTALGFGIGYLIDKDSFWPAVLAIVGLFVGLSCLITYLLIIAKDREKANKKKKEGEDKNGPKI